MLYLAGTVMEKHITKEKLEMFLRDELPGEEAAEILLHLDDCNDCRDLLPDASSEEMLEEVIAEETKITLRKKNGSSQ